MEADVAVIVTPWGPPHTLNTAGVRGLLLPARCPHWVAQGAGGANSRLPSICDQAALRGGPSFRSPHLGREQRGEERKEIW